MMKGDKCCILSNGLDLISVVSIQESLQRILRIDELHCITDTYQHTDSEKYSTLSVSKKISNQSSAFFSNQSTTTYERTPSLSYCNGTFYCYVIILFPTNCIKCFYNIERILFFFLP